MSKHTHLTNQEVTIIERGNVTYLILHGKTVNSTLVIPIDKHEIISYMEEQKTLKKIKSTITT